MQEGGGRDRAHHAGGGRRAALPDYIAVEGLVGDGFKDLHRLCFVGRPGRYTAGLEHGCSKVAATEEEDNPHAHAAAQATQLLQQGLRRLRGHPLDVVLA